MDMSTAPVLNLNTTTENRKKYDGAALRLLNLLIAGAKREEAARAVGVSAQYLTQLLEQEDFQFYVISGQREVSEKAITIDNDLLESELILAKKMKELAEFVTSPGEAVRMFKVVNDAKRKSNVGMPQNGDSGINGAAGSGTSGTVVNIVLPQFIQNQFVMNPNREIVGVGDRELVTLDSKALNRLVSPDEGIKELSTKYVKMPNSTPKPVVIAGKKELSREDKRSPSQWSADEL